MGTFSQRRPLGRATIGDQLRRHAQHQPEREAVVFIDPTGERRALTYGALDDRVNRLARSLAALGLVKGERVAVLSHNSADYVTAWYAALKLGAPLTGINFTFRPDEILYQVTHSGAAVLVVEDALLPVALELEERLPPSVRIRVVSEVVGGIEVALHRMPEYGERGVDVLAALGEPVARALDAGEGRLEVDPRRPTRCVEHPRLEPFSRRPDVPASAVCTAAERPYGVALAVRHACSTLLNGLRVSTGANSLTRPR